jgi:hypothetical protein
MRILREPDSLAHQFADEARMVLVRRQGWDLPARVALAHGIKVGAMKGLESKINLFF